MELKGRTHDFREYLEWHLVRQLLGEVHQTSRRCVSRQLQIEYPMPTAATHLREIQFGHDRAPSREQSGRSLEFPNRGGQNQPVQNRVAKVRD